MVREGNKPRNRKDPAPPNGAAKRVQNVHDVEGNKRSMVEGSMSARKNRRDFLKISGGALAASSFAGVPLFAQAGPVKIGVLASRSGVLGSIGEWALGTTQWGGDRGKPAGGSLRRNGG